MKKYVIKLIATFLAIFVLICSLCGIFYIVIVDKISTQKIGENLDSISESQSLSINTKLETDYEEFVSYVNANTLETDSASEKVAKLDTETPFFEAYPGGYGEYKIEDNCNTYTFNGKRYRSKNSNNEVDQALEQNYSFANFGATFNSLDGTNEFANRQYVVFKYNDVVKYFDSVEYFKPFYDNALSIKISGHSIITIDGVMYVHEKGEDTATQFFTYINYENSDVFVNNLKEKIKACKLGDTVSEKIRLNNEEQYLTVSKITDWNNAYDMYLVQYYTKADTKSLSKAFTTSLFAILLVIIVMFVLLSYLLFTVIRTRYESMNTNIIHRKNFGYQIKVKRDGTIIGYDSNFKKLLTNVTLYKNLKDFSIYEKYADVKAALTGQKIITLALSPSENVNAIDMYVRFAVVKGFDNCLLVGTDDTEQVSKNIRYRYQALYNPVSKRPNVEMLKKNLNAYIDEKKTRPEIKKASCIAIKAKKFNYYSDIFGMEVADRLVQKITDKIVSVLGGDSSSVYQIKDDVTGVFLQNLDSFKEANEFVEAIIDEFKRPADINGNTFIIDVCQGVYNIDLQQFPDSTGESIVEHLNKVIDKIQGLNSKNYEIFDIEYSRFLNGEESLSKDLSYALANNEFYLTLQPQYSNKLNKVVGLEALIRWNSPKYEKQSPQAFIELAEKNGMIIPIGAFILDKAFEYAKTLEQEEVEIAINVSPAQILQAGFVNDIIRLSEKHEVLPEKIALEVTETFLMDNYDLVVQKLTMLKREGFRIHLDDFGTGHSSLLYLKNLPIDAIKIDKEFVSEIENDSYSKSICGMQIQAAKELGLDLIAEGVERPAQNDILTSLGCDVIQGYMISKSLKLDDCIEFLHEKKASKIMSELKKGSKKAQKE